jgi:hypothetical protein
VAHFLVANDIFEEPLVGGQGAYWSPDGKQTVAVLFHWKRDEKGKPFLDNPADANYRIVLMSPDGPHRRELTLPNVEQVPWLGNPDWK